MDRLSPRGRDGATLPGRRTEDLTPREEPPAVSFLPSGSPPPPSGSKEPDSLTAPAAANALAYTAGGQMNPRRTILTPGSGLISPAMAAPDNPAAAATPAIFRQPLLTAVIAGKKTLDRVEVKEIQFAAHQQTGRHRHPCPVVGYIAQGSICFQVEGQPATVLRAGEAFFEPAQTTIVHFDATDEPATFIAYYLLGPEDHELIEMLP